MKERHRARQYNAAARRQTASLYEVEALPELIDVDWHFEKIIAVVGVSHDDEPAPGRLYSTSQSAAVAFDRGVNDSRAKAARYLSRTVIAAIIGDDDFS
jgi:hypothetical protein